MRYNNIFAVNEVKTLNKQELIEYFKEVLNGNIEARKIIITSNVRLVFNRVFKKFFNTPYEFDDLISIGLIGLMKAVDSFDITKGYTFSTYASRCIDNEILMFLRKSKKHLKNDSLNRILTTSSGELCTVEDTLIDPDSDFTLNYDNYELCQEIKRQVEFLDGREKEIIKLYFGFCDNIKYSGCEIAKMLNISQSYVSRIINRTLIKIKNNILELRLFEESNVKIKSK